ncbi:Pre-mRNA-splicing factor ISY1-like protein [Zancudomyces culisetae]|uniref:Pre-mRNA-splicing factor ISY1-like protein n=1 Tax=Zancudomyces culisetae TaxID=1213189 RepID=A0A1R1PX77_ZANCU|nr:Pre-mRNA-splicing factor ISY1-like protein [Zancudomyces culisetae]|eukprot:OMH85596.1 Pre-mRNA-splicing factor ISY1-like protein [Zancudomyces culisetae]
MARNQEKAQSMLYRFRQVQLEEQGLLKPVEKRPYLASIVNSLPAAEHWRRQVIKDITRTVAKIHDGSLPDTQIRDLNDEINKYLREKQHWETRIKELGGPDYKKVGTKIVDSEGREIAGNRGYKYFGRAKDLPGVREMLGKGDGDKEKRKKTRAELLKNIDADYYGLRDDQNAELLEYEAEVSRLQIEKLRTNHQYLTVTDIYDNKTA